MVADIIMVDTIVADTITIMGVDIEMDTTIIADIDTITDVAIEHKQDNMVIIRIKINIRTAKNITDKAIHVIKIQIDLQETEVTPKIKLIKETEVITEIHQEREIQHVTQVGHPDSDSVFLQYK